MVFYAIINDRDKNDRGVMDGIIVDTEPLYQKRRVDFFARQRITIKEKLPGTFVN